MKKIKEKLLNSDLIFLITGIIFFFIMLNIPVISDDAVRIEGLKGSRDLRDIWNYAMIFFKGEAASDSRILIILPAVFFAAYPRFVWAAFMALCMFVILKALSLIFPSGHKMLQAVLITLSVLSYKYSILSSAGWITTRCAYFSPMAFGILTLVPLRKLADKEAVKRSSCLLYALALIYSSNSEQIMLFQMLCGISFLIFLRIRDKKFYFYPALMICICMASAFFTLLSPGNTARIKREVIYFPFFMRMDGVNKFELGFDTAAYLFGESGRLWFLLACIFMTVLIFKKYKNVFFRAGALLLLIFSVCGTGLPQMLIHRIPYFTMIPAGGLFQAGATGPHTFINFFILILILVLFLEGIILSAGSMETLLLMLSLYAGGFASRVILGFAPSIYTSGERSAATMDFCTIAICAGLIGEMLARQGDDSVLLPAQKKNDQIRQ